MNTQALLNEARGMSADARWELAAALWESVETTDFPISEGTRAHLRARRAEAHEPPAHHRTWADIKSDWHATQR